MLRSDPLVEYVLIQPIFKTNEVPNDALWSDQASYMNALNFPEAWDIVKAEEGSVVIAVVDDAVDWTHEDLIDNIWSNPKEIADNGIGFSDFDRKNLFKPYFTTKKKGSGLGLSIVNKIINDHTGSIEFFKKSNGAKVILKFPNNVN